MVVNLFIDSSPTIQMFLGRLFPGPRECPQAKQQYSSQDLGEKVRAFRRSGLFFRTRFAPLRNDRYIALNNVNIPYEDKQTDTLLSHRLLPHYLWCPSLAERKVER